MIRRIEIFHHINKWLHLVFLPSDPLGPDHPISLSFRYRAHYLGVAGRSIVLSLHSSCLHNKTACRLYRQAEISIICQTAYLYFNRHKLSSEVLRRGTAS